MKKIMILLFAFLWVVFAHAGDLTVDNLTVSNNVGIHGKMDIYSLGTTTTNTNSLVATGGTITTNGNYRIHTFTNNGTFSVSSGAGSIDVLVVGGGGGGGRNEGGGGGGGGVVLTNITVTGSYDVVVGDGGLGQQGYVYPYCGFNGSNSYFGAIVAYGGGGGGEAYWGQVGQNGGCSAAAVAVVRLMVPAVQGFPDKDIMGDMVLVDLHILLAAAVVREGLGPMVPELQVEMVAMVMRAI